MPSIEEIAAQIRTAVYGRDVRENIALGIEKIKTGNSDNEVIHSIGYEKPGFVSLARFVDFVNGSYAYPTMTENTYQVTSRDPITAQENYYIRIADGFKATAYTITGASSSSSTGWQTNSIYIPKDKRFTIVVEKVTHDAGYTADIPEHVNALHVYDDHASYWYDAIKYATSFTTGQYIKYADGTTASSGGYYYIYKFNNPQFKRIKVFGSIYGRDVAEIAFYSTEDISAEGYMQSYSMQPGSWDQEHWTWADVPEGCKLVCACSRNVLNNDNPHEIKVYIDDITSYISEASIDHHHGMNLFNNYSYMHHYFADNLGNTPVAQNSFMDIELAHRLGFKAYEINAHATSTPGKYVCTHGVSGKIGNCLVKKNGEDVTNVAFNTVSYESFYNDYLYKTTNPKYATRPMFLDEALELCKKYNMIPYVGWEDYQLVDYVRKYRGQNFILGIYNEWYLKRTNHKGAFNYYATLDATQLQNAIDSVGAPFLYCVTNTMVRDMTDSQLLELAEICHKNNCLIGSAGVYQTVQDNIRLQNLGFDFCSVGWEVPPFDNGNLASIRDHNTYAMFDTDGSVDANGVLTLSSGQYMASEVGEKQILQGSDWNVGMTGDTIVMQNSGQGSIISAGVPEFGKGQLRIRYTGTLRFVMGSHIQNSEIASDGTKEVLLSSFFYRETPNFAAYAVGNVTITSCTFDASSV